jgi:hypothetical protein
MSQEKVLLIKGLLLGAAVIGYKAAIYYNAKKMIDSERQEEQEEEKAE